MGRGYPGALRVALRSVEGEGIGLMRMLHRKATLQRYSRGRPPSPAAPSSDVRTAPETVKPRVHLRFEPGLPSLRGFELRGVSPDADYRPEHGDERKRPLQPDDGLALESAAAQGFEQLRCGVKVNCGADASSDDPVRKHSSDLVQPMPR
jgi:hypothetical protein